MYTQYDSLGTAQKRQYHNSKEIFGILDIKFPKCVGLISHQISVKCIKYVFTNSNRSYFCIQNLWIGKIVYILRDMIRDIDIKSTTVSLMNHTACMRQEVEEIMAVYVSRRSPTFDRWLRTTRRGFGSRLRRLKLSPSCRRNKPLYRCRPARRPKPLSAASRYTNLQ